TGRCEPRRLSPTVPRVPLADPPGSRPDARLSPHGMTSSYAALADACRARPPRVGMILGSGLSGVTDELPLRHAVPFAELPGMPASSVAGHPGRVCLHEYEHGTLLVFQGRPHFYEGHPWDVVERPV